MALSLLLSTSEEEGGAINISSASLSVLRNHFIKVHLDIALNYLQYIV